MLCLNIIYLVVISLASVVSFPANDLKASDINSLMYNGSYDWILMPNNLGEPQLAILSEPKIFPKINVVEDVKFFLYTRSNRAGRQLFVDDHDLLLRSEYNENDPTKILIHGFGGGIDASVIADGKNAYLDKGNYNVIGVDWGNICKFPWYSSAKSNAKVAGEHVGRMIGFIVGNKPSRSEYIHIVGHSLGAHVGGFAGSYFYDSTERKVARITGLDSAKPLYELESADGSLDASDAVLVDIVHTNSGTLGLEKAHGHVDFYPNGGSKQPGCGLDLTGSCSHSKAVEYFINSIRNCVAFFATRCDDLNQAKRGECSGSGGFMGDCIVYGNPGIYHVEVK